MENPSNPDDDTVISPIGGDVDRTVVTGNASPMSEETLVEATARELDEKTRATQRRLLNVGPDSGQGARVAFAPEQQRERYAVRKGEPTLPGVSRHDFENPEGRSPVPSVPKPNGELVVALVVAVTILVAGAVGGILTLIFGH